MIIIKLQGGLGNQLFQYAFGRFLEDIYKKEVAYDDTFFRVPHRYTKRTYALNSFNTKVRIATDDEIGSVKYPLGFISRFFYFLSKALNRFFRKKYFIGYEPSLENALRNKNKAYVEGWWQTYKYAEGVFKNLLTEITLRHAPKNLFSEVANSMYATNSVLVHIRRGDYVGSAGLHVLNMSYYTQARLDLEKKVPSPEYFIFSDDRVWVRENMGDIFPNAHFVDDSTLTDTETFILMSQCKHAIIANSSFSWWAAYLIANKEKMVIAPKAWNSAFMPVMEDLCPSSWLLI